MKQRRTPRDGDQIRADIGRLLECSSSKLKHIHLIKCDFEKVERNPERFGLTKQKNGRLVMTHNKKLIEILAIE